MIVQNQLDLQYHRIGERSISILSILNSWPFLIFHGQKVLWIIAKLGFWCFTFMICWLNPKIKQALKFTDFFNIFLNPAQILSLHSLFLLSQSSTTTFKFNVILLFSQIYLVSNLTSLMAMAFLFQKSCSIGDSNVYAVEIFFW